MPYRSDVSEPDHNSSIIHKYLSKSNLVRWVLSGPVAASRGPSRPVAPRLAWAWYPTTSSLILWLPICLSHLANLVFSEMFSVFFNHGSTKK